MVVVAIVSDASSMSHIAGHGPFSHMFDGYFIPRVRPGLHWKVRSGCGAINPPLPTT